MMTPTSRLFDRLSLVLVIAVLMLPLTYLEVARPSWSQVDASLHNLTNRLPHASQQGSAPTTPTTTTIHSGTTAPAPTARTATTNSYVHLRAAKSVNSAILDNIASGVSVQLTTDADPTWQGVSYQGKTGYIFRTYLSY